ncbi:MAG: periplasmic heavy metal sensor [Candidatus Krumholzibacteria bacterium]|nr:periplasmic heavy metal sensor [Candidatus Krumholzibacteria bacterium]
MRKRVLLIGMALVLMVFLSASLLVAQEKATCEKERTAGQKEEMACQKQMKLTDEQKAKVEELRTDFRLKMIDLKAEREKLAIMLKKEITKSEPDMQAITALVKKMSAVREQCQLAGIEQALAMRKLVGKEWPGSMHLGMGDCRDMMEESEMGCGGGGENAAHKCGSMPRMRGMGAQAGLMGGCQMQGETPGAGSGPMMRQIRVIEGDRCMGGNGGGMMMMQKREGRCSNKPGNWNRMMFRQDGKKGCCRGMDRCMMRCGSMDERWGRNASKECHMEKGDKGETKCKIEIKEVEKEKSE